MQRDIKSDNVTGCSFLLTQILANTLPMSLKILTEDACQLLSSLISLDSSCDGECDSPNEDSNSHALNAFQLDTNKTTRKEFSRPRSLSNPWCEVTSNKQRQKARKVTSSPKSHATAASVLGNQNKPGTIIEESPKSSSAETRGQKCSVNHEERSGLSLGRKAIGVDSKPSYTSLQT